MIHVGLIICSRCVWGGKGFFTVGCLFFMSRNQQCQSIHSQRFSSGTRKMSSIDDRGQTDRVTPITRPYALDIWIFDLDLWPWLSIPGELWSWPIHARMYKQKLMFKGQSFQKIEWKQRDGRTDGRYLWRLVTYFRCSALSKCSYLLTDCCTFPANAVQMDEENRREPGNLGSRKTGRKNRRSECRCCVNK